MVKNKGFLPSNPSEIPVQREQIKSIVYSLLPACTQPDLHSGIPFQAQAIIANPPAYGMQVLEPPIFSNFPNFSSDGLLGHSKQGRDTTIIIIIITSSALVHIVAIASCVEYK